MKKSDNLAWALAFVWGLALGIMLTNVILLLKHRSEKVSVKTEATFIPRTDTVILLDSTTFKKYKSFKVEIR